MFTYSEGSLHSDVVHVGFDGYQRVRACVRACVCVCARVEYIVTILRAELFFLVFYYVFTFFEVQN
jgi:hypothetical protein